MLISGSTATVDSILLKHIVDIVEKAPDYKAYDLPKTMLIWCIIYGVWWESLNLMWRSYNYLFSITIPALKARIIDKLHAHVLHHAPNFFQKNMIGNISNRISEAARSFEMLITIVNERIFRRFVTMFLSIIAMYYVHFVFAIILSVWLLIFLSLAFGFSNRINHYSLHVANVRANIFGRVVDAIYNVSTVRMFSSYKYEQDLMRQYTSQGVDSEIVLQRFMNKIRFFQGLSCSIMIMVMLYFLIILRSKLLITVGDFVLIISLTIAITSEIWEISQDFGDLFEEIGTAKQSLSLVLDHEIDANVNMPNLKINDGTIEFNDVTFKYAYNNNIFSNKNVIIPGKQKIGLVGYSGSGKSTFVNLIIRAYNIDSGKINIDQQNIADVNLASLRNNIGYIPQDPILFDRSIRDNIRYGKIDATLEQIEMAARRAYIHDFIMQLPDGYDTNCGEKGASLSGGQRQRIAIARAILKNAPILILDEATSALDSITEAYIQDSLKELAKQKTVIIIAHRLSTLLNMDRILVFDKGNIVEDGSHKQLLANNNLYAKLWASQSGGFLADKSE